jgi:4,5-dihydroxyphthalate decarboxylase
MPEGESNRKSDAPLPLCIAIGKYPHTNALREGRISSSLVSLDFADVAPINRAFAAMVREQRFDVSEMAIATFLQAKAYGKPLVLLPVVLAARFQQSALLCRTDSDISGPRDLIGRRVGVRAYGQTTGVWLRGILADRYELAPEAVRWITFEDAHVAECRDPPWAARAPAGSDLLTMLRQGELDAVIVGNEVPNDAMLRTVFPDPEAEAAAFWKAHRFVPVNHLLTVREDIARRRPDVVVELVRLFREAKAAGLQITGEHDPYPFGCPALQPAIDLVLRYAMEQGLLPHLLQAHDVWKGLPDDLR